MNLRSFFQRRGAVLVIVLFVGIAGLVHAQNNSVKINRASGGSTNLEVLNAKLDRIIQQQGGRYVFIVSGDGDLWRLDTFSGKVAILNLVSGAEWDTLDVPEKTLRPGNAFYEQFVQKLDGIDFNTN